ncbi:unnamed protein product, partial [Mesorhabditis spiculigera]
MDVVETRPIDGEPYPETSSHDEKENQNLYADADEKTCESSEDYVTSPQGDDTDSLGAEKSLSEDPDRDTDDTPSPSGQIETPELNRDEPPELDYSRRISDFASFTTPESSPGIEIGTDVLEHDYSTPQMTGDQDEHEEEDEEEDRSLVEEVFAALDARAHLPPIGEETDSPAALVSHRSAPALQTIEQFPDEPDEMAPGFTRYSSRRAVSDQVGGGPDLQRAQELDEHEVRYRPKSTKSSLARRVDSQMISPAMAEMNVRLRAEQQTSPPSSSTRGGLFGGRSLDDPNRDTLSEDDDFDEDDLPEDEQEVRLRPRTGGFGSPPSISTDNTSGSSIADSRRSIPIARSSSSSVVSVMRRSLRLFRSEKRKTVVEEGMDVVLDVVAEPISPRPFHRTHSATHHRRFEDWRLKPSLYATVLRT